MRKGHLHICLFQPEIPQNTGNIARLTAATGCRLHLILPLGFNTEEKQLRRPGLDYWPYLDLEIHDSFEDFCKTVNPQKMAFFSAKATQSYQTISPEVDVLIFGRETSGLPPELRERYAKQLYKIPIFHPKVRSLNLANCVALTVYHQLHMKGIT